jgi:hypothetical protein
VGIKTRLKEIKIKIKMKKKKVIILNEKNHWD